MQRKGSAHAPTVVQKPKRKLFSRSKGKGKKKQKAEQDDDRNEAQDGDRSLYSERDQGTASIESVVEPTEYVDKDSTFAFEFSLNGVYQLGQTYNDAIVSTIFPVQGDQSADEPTVVAESEDNGAEKEKVVEQEAKEEECFAEVVDEVVNQETKQEESIAGVEEIEVVAKQEAKKEECFAEVEEEVVKREAKKKRGLFGRKKHQQNEAKSHADEKRELDSEKSPVMSDARDEATEADEAAATVADQKTTAKITSKEEEKENNVDESSCCKDKNTKEMGAKTNAQESNSRLGNRFANKIDAIFQLESNSLIKNSLKEGATFQAKPVPSPEQDCNAIGKNTEADELQIAKNNTDMEGQEILGKVVRDDNTVVSFLTQATGQTMWTRYFGPALYSSQKKESEVRKEDDDNVEKSDSFIGSVGGDTDTVVSGLTLASGQTKWTRYKTAESREMEPIYEEKEGEESIISKSGQISGNSGSVVDSASKPMSINSVKSCNNTTVVEEKNSMSNSSAKTNSSGSTAAKTAQSSKIRGEDTDFEQKTVPSTSRSIKSFCRSRLVKSKSYKAKHTSSPRSVQSKSSKTRSTSRASIAPASTGPASASSVKSSGSSSKSSKAKATSSDATVTSGSNQSFSQDTSGIEITRTRTAPLRPMTAYVSPAMIRRKNRAKEMSVSQQKTDEPSSASSVKSAERSSKSPKAKAPSSDETTVSIPTVPSSSCSVKSSGVASKCSRTRPSSRASIESAPTVPSSSSSVKSSSSGSSKPSKAKDPSSGETTASIPTVPSSSRSVKSSGGASKSSKTRPPSRATSIASAPTVVASAPSQSFSQHVAGIEITRTRTAPLRPMTAYVSPAVIRRKNRGEDTDVSQQKSSVSSGSESVKSSSSGSSKSSILL